jgi:hypothetical protein
MTVVDKEKLAALRRRRNDQSGEWPLQQREVPMDSRAAFAILRLYLRVILWGDPYDRKPKAKQQKSQAASAARLKPVTQAE